jgi:hypothetical protein
VVSDMGACEIKQPGAAAVRPGRSLGYRLVPILLSE